MSIIKELPSMRHTFTIQIKGLDTGRVYDGTFTYERPNLRKKSEIAKTTARLNEDLKSLDEDACFLHKVLSTLRHTLSDAPEWWVKADYGMELYDINVVLDVYRECQKFEEKWFAEVWKEKSEEKK